MFESQRSQKLLTWISLGIGLLCLLVTLASIASTGSLMGCVIRKLRKYRNQVRNEDVEMNTLADNKRPIIKNKKGEGGAYGRKVDHLPGTSARKDLKATRSAASRIVLHSTPVRSAPPPPPPPPPPPVPALLIGNPIFDPAITAAKISDQRAKLNKREENIYDDCAEI